MQGCVGTFCSCEHSLVVHLQLLIVIMVESTIVNPHKLGYNLIQPLRSPRNMATYPLIQVELLVELHQGAETSGSTRTPSRQCLTIKCIQRPHGRFSGNFSWAMLGLKTSLCGHIFLGFPKNGGYPLVI